MNRNFLVGFLILFSFSFSLPGQTAPPDSGHLSKNDSLPSILRQLPNQQAGESNRPQPALRVPFQRRQNGSFADIIRREKAKPKWARDFRRSPYFYPNTTKRQLFAAQDRDPGEVNIIRIFPILELKRAYHFVNRLRRKKTLDADALRCCEKELQILFALWRQSPQSRFQLYRREHLRQKYSQQALQNALDRLWKNGFIDYEQPWHKLEYYIPAVSKSVLLELLHRLIAEAAREKGGGVNHLYSLLNNVLRTAN